jgi:hypothetical protein
MQVNLLKGIRVAVWTEGANTLAFEKEGGWFAEAVRDTEAIPHL